MGEALLANVGTSAVFTGAILLLLAMLAVHRITVRRGYGFLSLFPYPILLSLAVLIFFSPRAFIRDVDIQGDTLTQPNVVSRWTGPIASLFLVLVSLDCVASYAMRRIRTDRAPYRLLLAFVVFWATTVASPALLGADGAFSHDNAYTLLLGCAVVLLSPREGASVVLHARNALLLFLALSVVLIPVYPTLVLDRQYTGGLLHGVPRLAGLASHSVTLGMLAQLALLCLCAKPLTRRSVNVTCWALGLFTLFLAQSKTSWVSFPLCAACMFWFRRAGFPATPVSTTTRRRQRFALSLALTSIVAIAGLRVMLQDAGLSLGSLWGRQGAQMATFTGRDQIWAVALADWERHPVFGYGSNLFDRNYRTSIPMPYAANGHNQFIDTLARSGLVGAAGLSLYAFLLLYLSVHYASATRGLSLALVLALAARSVTEVPLSVSQYSPEMVQHALLLAVLASAARSRHLAEPVLIGVRLANHRPMRITTAPDASGGVWCTRREPLPAAFRDVAATPSTRT